MVRLTCDTNSQWWLNLCRFLKPTFDKRRAIDIDHIVLQQLWVSICNETLIQYEATLFTTHGQWQWYIDFYSEEKMTLFLLTWS